METLHINNNQIDFLSIINNQKNEPVIIKNDTGLNYLLMPFASEKLQEIFLIFYRSINQIQNLQDGKTDKMTGKNFTSKWLGFMKDANIPENHKDEYNEYLMQKYK